MSPDWEWAIEEPLRLKFALRMLSSTTNIQRSFVVGAVGEAKEHTRMENAIAWVVLAHLYDARSDLHSMRRKCLPTYWVKDNAYVQLYRINPLPSEVAFGIVNTVNTITTYLG